MEELRFILSGNDPVNNTYCRIANMVLFNEDSAYHIYEHIRIAKEQFINRYKFIPKIEIMNNESLNEFGIEAFKKAFENSFGIPKEAFLPETFLSNISEKYLPEFLTKKKCTCGGTSDYCICNVTEVIEYKDPKTTIDNKIVEKEEEGPKPPLLVKTIQTIFKSKEYGYQLLFDVVEKTASLIQKGVQIKFPYEDLEDVLDEIDQYLSKDGNV